MNKVEEKVRELYPDFLHGESFNDGHLGGCNIYGDPATHHPIMWKFLVDELKIESVLDVGCGFGYSLDYFKTQMGLDAYGIEGSAKVAEVAVTDKIKVHDFCKGPYLSKKGYDLIWSSEFVEHVPAQYVDNFMSTFCCAKFVAITYASIGQSGHNHVNENTQEYWINIFEEKGFKFCPDFTQKLREKAVEDFNDPRSPVDQSKVKGWKYPYHFATKGLFFEKDNEIARKRNEIENRICS